MKNNTIEIPQGYYIDEEKSTVTNIIFKPIEKKWVDLGLPSGTLWCNTNEEGYYSLDEMFESFDENSLPKLTDFAELYDYCDWQWDNEKKGMWVIGPNTNGIFLPASGYRHYYNGSLNNVGYNGYYWSNSPCNYSAYNLYFNSSDYVYPSNNYNRANGQSVRLIKRK